MARVRETPFPISVTVSGAAAYGVVMVYGVRPLLTRFLHVSKDDGGAAVATSILLALGSAAVTEVAGLHLAFGAFFAASIMPRHPEMIDHVVQKLETVTNFLLFPCSVLIPGYAPAWDWFTARKSGCGRQGSCWRQWRENLAAA
jgi:Kef-type K+ transport system membrane component KefB